MTPSLQLLLLLASSCLLSLLLTPLARFLALRYHLVDRPDGHRKLHARPIPLAGGPAILLASCLALGATLYLAPEGPLSESRDARLFPGLLLASLVICVLGVVDDSVGLRGRQKLCGQVVAVSIVMAFGVQVQYLNVFGLRLELGLFGLPFTALLLLGAINALNLLDGMDGLLSSVGIVICAGMALMAALGGHWEGAAVAVTLVGAVLGFLRYNLPPASVFLGDSGSMLIGLVVGVLAIQSSLKGPATMFLAAPVALLTIPFLDTLAAIIRRKLTGRSLYTTDRGHLHHCLQRRGIGGYRVLFLVGGLCLITSVGALCSTLYNNELVAILSVLIVVNTLVVTRLFGHAEAGLMQKWLKTTLLSLLPRGLGKPLEQAVHLQGSAPWGQHWNQLIECAEKLQLRSLRLDVHAPVVGEGYHAHWHCGVKGEEEGLWRTDIPLLALGKIVGRVRIAGQRDMICVSEKVSVIADVVEEIESLVLTLIRRKLSPVDAHPARVQEEERTRTAEDIFSDTQPEVVLDGPLAAPSQIG